MNPYAIAQISSLALLMFVVVTSATPLVRRSAEFSTDIVVPANATEKENYDARYKIWVEQLNFALDYKMSMVCRTIIRSAPAQGGPKEGCDKVLQHKSILGYACTDSDIQIFEEVACGFDKIVVPTLPPPTTTTTSRPPIATPPRSTTSSSSSSTSSEESSSSSSSTSSEASSSSSASTTTQSTESPSTKTMVVENTTKTESIESVSSTIPEVKPDKPITEMHNETSLENSTSRDSVELVSSTSVYTTDKISTTGPREKQNTSMTTRDSRLSEACNKQLETLAQSLNQETDKTEIHSACHKLNVLARDRNSVSQVSQLGLPQEDALVVSCTEEELPLLHDTLCRGQTGEVSHALHGQQQKRVNYVIKTELSASCRRAVSPLGENQMEEDVTDSCLTLSGVQGEELVSNELCTPGDLDNLIKVVCDSAPGLQSPGYRTFILVSLSVLVSLLRMYF